MTCNLRVRESIVFTPTWGHEYQGYAHNYCRTQQWRCDYVHDLSDLMQDAYLVFVKVKDGYPRVIDAPHFMALFKVALRNSLHDKANYRQRKDSLEDHLSTDVSESCTGRIGEIGNAGYIAALIAEMPEELRLALNMLAKGLLNEREEKQPGLQPRESLSMQLRRLLRLPINSDPLTMIKRFLTA